MPNRRAITILGIDGLPEIRKGDDVGQKLFDALKRKGLHFRSGDILVITQKVVSKSEGRVVNLSDVQPSQFSIASARKLGKDPRLTEVILSESRRFVKMVRGLILVETAHGFVCANAGVDQSNVPKGTVTLLPKDPDASARGIRLKLKKLSGHDISVIVSDTFGRPWREGQTNVAIGISGLQAVEDYRGKKDKFGYELKASEIAVVDELASAAELVMGKLENVPAALIHGYARRKSEESAKVLVRKPTRDLFR